MRLEAIAVLFGLAIASCTSPYCGARGEPCCGTECAPSLVCSNDVCLGGPAGGNVGEPCGDLGRCASGLTCAFREQPSGDIAGYCETECGPAGECPELHTCAIDENALLSCMAGGSP